MHDIILKLRPHIFGPEKLIIFFEYNKQIAELLYSKMLIKKNELHNKNTELLN